MEFTVEIIRETDDESMLNQWVIEALAGQGRYHFHDFAPATDWTDAWKLLHDGLITWGEASIAWSMEEYGREPGDICWVTMCGWTVLGEFRIAVCQAWLLAYYIAEDDRD